MSLVFRVCHLEYLLLRIDLSQQGAAADVPMRCTKHGPVRYPKTFRTFGHTECIMVRSTTAGKTAMECS